MTPAELMREDAAKVADKWATDLQRRHGNGGPAAEIRRLPLPAETAEPTDTARMRAAFQIDLKTGHVILSPGMSPDAGAKAFWMAVEAFGEKRGCNSAEPPK